MEIEQGAGKIAKCLKLMLSDKPGHLASVMAAIASKNASVGDIHLLRVGRTHNTREIVVYVDSDHQFEEVVEAIANLEGIIVEDEIDLVHQVHEGGKIATKSQVRIETITDVRQIYTPGVAAICKDIERYPEHAHKYTSIPNQVAIVTNGTAILGLGDIGAVAGMPVMEGKSVLFDYLVGVSGVPILIQNRDPKVIIDTVRNIAPTFGAIKLEDIKAPECFEIEDVLDAELDIPVMHDDQHGTAVVVVGVVGLGAAGMGISKLLLSYGVKNVIGTDLDDTACDRLATAGGAVGSLDEVMKKAHVVIATTGCPGLIKPEMVRKGSVVLALSNPNPEIVPDLALQAGASFAADGKSVNNALAFPGLFRGALNVRATRINNKMKIAAAKVIAKHAEESELVPSILHPSVHKDVTAAVERAALESGVVKHWD
jgi:malate dehydrogenase (oxaloacetate-decarboxylating)